MKIEFDVKCKDYLNDLVKNIKKYQVRKKLNRISIPFYVEKL